MIHTVALYLPRRIEEHVDQEEQIVCVCGEIFESEFVISEDLYRDRVLVTAVSAFALHLMEANSPFKE